MARDFWDIRRKLKKQRKPKSVLQKHELFTYILKKLNFKCYF